jgi:hypothetical protein
VRAQLAHHRKACGDIDGCFGVMENRVTHGMLRP